MFAFSTTTFHCQFYENNRFISATERRAIHIALASPFNAWPIDIIGSMHKLGFHSCLPILQIEGKATLLRHAMKCNVIDECEKIIENELNSDDALLCPVQFPNWLSVSIYNTSKKARRHALGLAAQIDPSKQQRFSSKPQLFFVSMFRNCSDRDARFLCAVRHKLMLIGCNHVTDYGAEQFAQRLRVAARTLPASCMHAAVGTIMNAWCMDVRLGGDKDCVFCGAISCDRIQHVCQCPAVCDALYASLASPFSLPEVLSFNHLFLLGCTNPSTNTSTTATTHTLRRKNH